MLANCALLRRQVRNPVLGFSGSGLILSEDLISMFNVESQDHSSLITVTGGAQLVRLF